MPINIPIYSSTFSTEAGSFYQIKSLPIWVVLLASMSGGTLLSEAGITGDSCHVDGLKRLKLQLLDTHTPSPLTKEPSPSPKQGLKSNQCCQITKSPNFILPSLLPGPSWGEALIWPF